MVDLDAVRVFFRAAPFMVDLGVEPTEVSPGRLLTMLALQPRHHQHTGHVHAGVCSALADHSMGAAAQTLAAPGFTVMTAELKVSCLRAARGSRLECEASVIKPGRSISFTEAQVWCVDGSQRTLVVKASATMALTSRR